MKYYVPSCEYIIISYTEKMESYYMISYDYSLNQHILEDYIRNALFKDLVDEAENAVMIFAICGI